MRCDIIMPVWNQPDFTRDCVNSILKNTDVDYALVIIDNASDIQTAKYLDGLKNMAHPRVSVLRNEKNLGFVKAVNMGISASDATLVCVLNNDTSVTRGWLATMMRISDMAKDIGIVNPSSNNLGQRPEKGESIEDYAAGLEKERERFVELGAAIGFCMLIKREVIQKIGLFDEIYGMGNFEDTDFSRRAVKEGYRCVRACGAYVYHREGASFNRIRTFESDFKRNKEIYEFRWGRPRRIAYVLDRCDANNLKRINMESVRLARLGNWVWYFLKDDAEVPAHSNIIRDRLPARNFYLNAAWKILKKKKRFDEIFVGEVMFGRILEYLAFLHKAQVKYY